MVAVDVGGTFTDVIAIEGDEISLAKAPTDLNASETSILEGAAAVGVERASVFNLASTAGLNAVITRNIPKVAFLTTLGHRDMLDRGRLKRPYEALTDPHWRRAFGDAARPLAPRYLRRGIWERITAQGEVFIALDEAQARAELRVLKRCGVEGVAICLINAYVNPAHEQRLAELVREELGVPTSISSEISPLAKEYARASTTLIDVIMKLKYADYTARLQAGLGRLGFTGAFNYADCAARLMPADYAMERPFKLIVGGPAAGTAASAHFGEAIGDGDLLCADVGGTSCDISVISAGRSWSNTIFEVEDDLIVNALSTDIVTLGAGGGSIVGINATGELTVGPASAGSTPGPACYGKGGAAPTLSDAALLIGVLSADRFFDGKMPLRADLARAAFEALDTTLSFSQRVADAWRIAANNVAEGLMNITIRRGIDPRDFSLMAYGAAGPMLLPSLLDVFALKRVIVPPNPGLFSALGLLCSEQVFSDERSAYLMLEPDVAPRIDGIFAGIEEGLLRRVGQGRDRVTVRRSFDARVHGQSWETPFVAAPDGAIGAAAIEAMTAAFHDAYELRNGHRFESMPVQAVTFRVQVAPPGHKFAHRRLAAPSLADEPVSGLIEHLYGEPVRALHHERAALGVGRTVKGPAVIHEPLSTTFVPLGRAATVGAFGELSIT
jgi:N-methylhydantoinase A